MLTSGRGRWVIGKAGSSMVGRSIDPTIVDPECPNPLGEQPRPHLVVLEISKIRVAILSRIPRLIICKTNTQNQPRDPNRRATTEKNGLLITTVYQLSRTTPARPA